MAESDDILPEQRDKTPTPAELTARARLATSRTGRLARLKSWATVLVAALAIAAGLYLFGFTD